MCDCLRQDRHGRGGRTALEPNATFAGFTMDEDYPLAFVVMVENGGYGRSVCIPILSQVLSACMEDMNPG